MNAAKSLLRAATTVALCGGLVAAGAASAQAATKPSLHRSVHLNGPELTRHLNGPELTRHLNGPELTRHLNGPELT